MIKFHKVSLTQWKKDCKITFYRNGKEETPQLREGEDSKKFVSLKLPKRATKGSAGYDFYSPFGEIELQPGDSVKMPLGIKAEMDSNVVLLMHPRSSLGFKYKLQLANTTGIIDSDYFYSDNEGHIFVKLVNDGDKVVNINKDDAICQGIFVNYLLTDDDDTTKTRNGGFGSTD